MVSAVSRPVARKWRYSATATLAVRQAQAAFAGQALLAQLCRQHWAAVGVRFLLGAGDRVLYSVMPLYHSSGGQIGTACTLTFGNKTVIKAKFSARNFFKDCAKYNATVRRYSILPMSVIQFGHQKRFLHFSGRKFHRRDLPLSPGHAAVAVRQTGMDFK